MKRLCSWLLTCVVLLGLLPAGAWAAEEEYAYSGGSGTQEDPYLIATVEDLRMVKNNGGAHFLQIADIDIGNSGGYVWWDEPDAITLLASGSYNGGGYRILNFKSRYTGLFARNLGTVENVTMENVSVETVNEFTTQLGALVNWNQGTVKNCTVQGSVSVRTTAFYDDPNFFVGGIVGQNGSWEYDGMGLVTGCTLEAGSRVGCRLFTSGDIYVGGIVGRSSAPVRDCSNLAGSRGMISISNDDGSWIGCAGGIAGYTQGEVTGCVNTTPVYGTSAGGIVGRSELSAGDGSAGLRECRNEGSVTGRQAGGIVGLANYDAVVLECGNSGQCTGTAYAGGIIGACDRLGTVSLSGCWNEGKISGTDVAGGILGTTSWQFTEKCAINGCLNTGIVEGETTGGILGKAYNETSITSSYNRGDLWWTEGGCGGGIVGSIEDNGRIQSCYNTGTITYSETDAGEIAGNVESGSATAIQDCFWIESDGMWRPLKAVGNSPASAQITNCETLAQADFTGGTALEKLNAGEGGWYADLENVNGGFPVPAWQCASACVQAGTEPGLCAGPFDLTLTLPGEGSIFYRLGETGAWTAYTGPVRISESCTVQAYGRCASGDTPVSSFQYRLARYPVAAATEPGTYTEAPIAVPLSCPSAPDADIYYTTDGSDPTAGGGTQGKTPVLSHSATLRAAAKVDGEWGDVMSFDYVISPSVTASPEPGEYTAPIDVTLSCAGESFNLYYTVNGIDPRQAGRRYDGTPIPVSTSTQLKVAAGSGGGWGEVHTFAYTIAEPEIITAHPSGHYEEAFYLDLSSNTPGLEIYVTTGTVFHKYESELDRPMYQDAAVRVQLRYQGQVVKEETLEYTFPELEVTASPSPGSKEDRVEVDLECTLGGLELRYTLDGSAPTASSPLYEDGMPIPIARTCTLKAAAFMPGGEQAIGSWDFAYTLMLPEVMASPAPGIYATPFEVELSMVAPNGGTTDGYQIYYTTDGSDPAERGQLYVEDEPIQVTTGVTIRAVPVMEIPGLRRVGIEGVFTYQARTYSFTLSQPGAGGVVNGTASGLYEAGTEISLTAAPDEGYYFSQWSASGITLDDAGDPELTFAMPANAVTVTPVFRREMPAAGTNGMFQAEIGTPDESAVFISTPEELAAIGTDPDYPLNGSYLLAADLDLSGYENWTPIGTHAAPFTGTFDGYGHVISGLTIDNLLGYAGLFGRVSETGVIKNLGLENVSITVDGGGVMDSGYVGGIAGRMGGNDGSSAELRNCYVTGRITASYDSGSLYLGGLAGQLDADVSDCFNLAALSGRAGSDQQVSDETLYMGGLAGMIDTYLPDHYVVERCFNAGELTPSCFQDVAWVGGIVGYLSNQVELSQCYNTADVWMSPLSWCGRSAYLGGIAGFSASDITDCYNLGDVGTDSAGSTPYYTMLCGGIVGQFATMDDQAHEFSRCYNAGAVVSRSYYSGYAGGIVGSTVLARELKIQDCVVASPRIGACYDYMSGSQGGDEFQSAVVGNHISMGYYSYYLNTVEGVGYSPYLNKSNAFSATSSQILGQELYENNEWDFTSIWVMDPARNGGMPSFQWQRGGCCILGYSGSTARVYSGRSLKNVTLLVSSYDDNGRMLESACMEGELTGGVNQFYLPLTQKGTQIKIFLLQAGTMKPLTNSITIAQ